MEKLNCDSKMTKDLIDCFGVKVPFSFSIPIACTLGKNRVARDMC